MDEEKFKKLPKWAQNYITLLEANLTNYKGKLLTYSNRVPSSIFVEYGVDTENKVYLPEKSTFAIQLGDGWSNKCQIHKNLKGEVEIFLDDMCVSPRSGNHLIIRRHK